MLKRLSILGTFLMGAVCSVAYGLQPSVRAGSLSLNTGLRPTGTNATTSSVSAAPAGGVALNSARGSTISKFSSSVVPVAGHTKENPTFDDSVLDEIRQQIRDLQDAQLALENSQLNRDDVEDTIINQFQTVNLTTTNRDLKNALTDIRSDNQSLRSSLNSIQQQTDGLDDLVAEKIDNRLKVRGLVDDNNHVSFANKSDIEPATLAQNLTSNTYSKTILTNELQPSTNTIKEIIADDLKDREILANDGSLNVEKKGAIQINESTVTNALRNSSAFKNMVSDEVATKGYVTESALANKDYITTSDLNNRNYLTSDSAAIRDLATKSEIAPDYMATKLVGNSTAKATLENAIGTNTTTVNNLINSKLTETGIVDSRGNRQFATLNDLPVINEQTVAAALGDSSVISDAVVNSLKNKQILNNSGTRNVATLGEMDELDGKITNLNSQLSSKADATDLSASNIANILAGNNAATSALGNALKDTTALTDKFALKTDVVNVDDELIEAAVNDALTNSTTLSGIVDEAVNGRNFITDTNLNTTLADYVTTTALNNRGFLTSSDLNERGYLTADSETIQNLATKADVDPETLADNTAFTTKFALKGEGGSGTGGMTADDVNELIDNRNFADAATVSTINNSLNTLSAYVNGGVEDEQSLLHAIKNDETIRDALKGDPGATGPQGEPGPAGQDADAGQVANILMADSGFKASVKGEPGTGITYKGEVNQHSELPTTNLTQGDAYYNYADGLLYIYSCDNNNVCKFPDSGRGVPFKGNPGETGQSAWYAYCISNNNWSRIITKLYPTLNDCTEFTAAQYAAIMGGARAYCLSILNSPAQLSATTGLGSRLNRVFDTDVVATLQRASDPFAVTVQLNGTPTLFLDACEAKYNDIMAGEDGEAGTPGQSAKDIYCEAQAENYPTGTTNLDAIIKPLYSSVNSCDDFQDWQYNAIMGGARAYCLSLANRISNNTAGTEMIARLDSALVADNNATSVRNLAGSNNLQGVMSATFNGGLKFVPACEAKYNEILAGKSAAQLYCEAQAENYPDGTTNLTIIKKLFPNATVGGTNGTCADFTDAQYAAIMGGANAYCTTFTATFDRVSLDEGPGLRLARALVDTGRFSTVTQATAQLTTLQGRTATERLSTNIGTTNPITLLQACIDNFNRIMAGDDGNPGTPGQSAKDIYCEAQAENYPDGTTNLTIIKKLFPNATVGGTNGTCADFTDAQYAAIMGGAQSYCTTFTATFNNVDLNSGPGLRLAHALVDTGRFANVSDATAQLSDLQDMNATTRLSTNIGTNNPITLLSACIENFNRIMAGENGEPGTPGQSAKDIYCEAQAENYPDGTTNLTIIKKLFPNATVGGTNGTCADFTDAQYAAIMGGAQSYCTTFTATFNNVDLNSGPGLRLAHALVDTGRFANVSDATAQLSDLQDMNATTRLSTNIGTTNPITLLNACIENFNRIMAGEDGEAGTPGQSAKDIYCEAQAENYPTGTTNLDAIIKPLYSSVNSCDDFQDWQYNAIMGGARAYCLSLANRISVNDVSPDVLQRANDLLSPDATSARVNDLVGQPMATIMSATFNNGQKFVPACEAKYNEILAGQNGQSAAEIWCESRIIGADVTRVLTPAQMMSTVSVFSTAQIDSTRNLFVSLQACLDAVAANPALMGGESASDQAYNKDRTSMTFDALKTENQYATLKANFVASLKGVDGRNGDNGESAATIWCKAHSKEVDGITPIALTPTQIIKSVIATGDGYIDSEQNLFASVDACEEVIAANPDLMSGESAADENLNNEIRTGKSQISEYIADPQKFGGYQRDFIPNMKAELKGADGKTFVPSINAANGTLSWAAVTGDPTNPASFNLNENAVNAVKADLNVASGTSLSDALNNKAVDAIKTDLGVTSGTLSNALNTNAIAAVKNSIDASASNLQAAIDARATAKANTQINSLSSRLLTAQDLINLINSGALTIANNQVSLSSVSLNPGDENAASVASSLRKMDVTYTCSGTGTQQCPAGGAPALISNNP